MFLLKRIFSVMVILGVLGLATLFALYLAMKSSLPSVVSLKDLQWQTPMQIYTADGLLMNQFGEKKRIPLPLSAVPQQLIDAILATEDDRFYQHFGVDPIGLGRAIWGQIIGVNKGGASTISMQVARNFFGSTEQTYTRKLREIFTTFHIEYLLTKDEILALYINKIPLGHRAFGFGAAAQVYYNKELQDLNLAQIAVLAGLPKAPSTMNPISRPDRALTRRSVVLQRMYVSGYISEQELKRAKNAPITAKKHGAEIEFAAPYVSEMAHLAMVERYGREQAYTGGYKVYTTVSSATQHAAQQAVRNNITAYDLRHGYRGAITTLINGSNELMQTAEQHEQTGYSQQTTGSFSEQQIAQALANVDSYHVLQPAVVIDVQQNSATIVLKDNIIATIDWSGMAWARPYINDRKQGPAPITASDILAKGDVIYVINQAGSYSLSQLPAVSSALISLSVDNGAIQAAVGGYSYKQSQFNRVTQAKRQVGSNIKPFLYSAALDHGFTLASLVNDVPINQWDRSTGQVWRPKNSPPKYSGEIRVKLALAQSKNVIAVRLLRAIGLDKVIPHIASFGFSPDDLPRNESLALGSASLTPLEIAAGYAVFANGGFLIEPYIIDRVEDSFANVVYRANPAIACDDCTLAGQSDSPEALSSANVPSATESSVTVISNSQANGNNSADQLSTELMVNQTEQPLIQAERVISAENAFLVTQALHTAIWGADWSNKPYWQGTGYRAQTLKRRDIGGKTGTTNSAKDAWFSGFSRRLVTTTWIGFDNPSKELGRTTKNKNLASKQTFGAEAGAKSAQPAWIDFMAQVLPYFAPESFVQPDNIVSVRIDKSTGKLTEKTDKTTDFEFFMIGTTPTDYVQLDNSNDIIEGGKDNDEHDIF